MEDQEGSFRTEPPEERALPEGQRQGTRRVQESALPSRNLNHQNSLSTYLCFCDKPLSSPPGSYPIDGYALELSVFVPSVSDCFGHYSDNDKLMSLTKKVDVDKLCLDMSV